LEAHRFPRADDSFTVEREAGDLDRFGAGSDDQALRRFNFDRLTRRLLYGDRVRARDFPAPFDEIDAVCLEERSDPAGELLDDLVLPDLHGRRVDSDAVHLNADLGSRCRLFVEVRHRNQRLGRNAAPIEANAAHFRLFDAHGFLAELRQPDSANVTAWTPSEDDRVVGMFRHGSTSLLLPPNRRAYDSVGKNPVALTYSGPRRSNSGCGARGL
jgi:hypothetical protein